MSLGRWRSHSLPSQEEFYQGTESLQRMPRLHFQALEKDRSPTAAMTVAVQTRALNTQQGRAVHVHPAR